MSETTCRWVASDQARIVPGRHEDGCNDETCRGCQECRENHCDVGGTAHVPTAGAGCPSCVGTTREDIAEIVRMTHALPTEVTHRGTASLAMTLLGPAADPEARGHQEASARAGRIPELWTDGNDDRHPLWVLGVQAMVYRAEFEHDEPTTLATVDTEAAYLDRHLTRISTWPHLRFGDMAREIRHCRGHIEDVLHDGERETIGAPCVKCQTRTVRHQDDEGHEWWWCKRCKRNLSPDQYRLACRVAYVAHASRLPAIDLADRINVPASTIRRWAGTRHTEDGDDLPPLLPYVGRDHNGRKVYSVEDAECLRDNLRGDEVA